MSREIIPIFIMGVPRSGTTFLASSIASHSNVIALPEMHYVFRLMEEEMIYGSLSSEVKIGLLKEDFYFCSMELFESDDELKLFVDGKGIKQLILAIIELYNKKYDKKTYTHWVEHSPHSHYYLHLIKYYFPNAKFIHSLRDPRAVYRSTIREPWGFKDIITGAKNWNVIVRDILTKEKCYDVYTVKYEGFVDDIEKSLKVVSVFIGVNYSPMMLTNEGFRVHDYFRKERSFFGEKADSSRKDKWKESLTKKEIEHINAINYSLMIQLGYLHVSELKKEIVGIEMYAKRILGMIKHAYLSYQFKKNMRGKFC